MEPIRVLQIVTYMGRGGLETMLMNYYRHIDRAKVQFDFLVHRDFKADYDDEIQSLGGRIFHFPRLIPWSLSYRRRLKGFLEEHPEYKIVHVHQDCLSSVALQCADKCGVPVRIAHSHNSSQDKNLRFIIKKHYMKQIPQFATDFLSCSKKAGDWMFGSKPYQLIANAIDINCYSYNKDSAVQIRKEFGITNELVIGHVGGFRKQKNHLFLLEIMKEIIKDKPEAKLLLVGDGDEMASVKTGIQKSGLEENVILAGNRQNVNEIMRAMDIFVFPSFYEGLPVTMIEAQASGLHCVISDKVPKECIVTKGLVTVMNLSDPAVDWAKHILSQANLPREDHTCEIKKSGYDITIEAQKLEKFYLDKIEG
ncbi:MAG TPA: glycosyltransferase family 1 protein [Candidatus Mediterraneibacter excrementigallinarum]|nr:glycosyltransferase family 1 protein [Candidatus Mediterraneibacter excrementigallinarum]